MAKSQINTKSSSYQRDKEAFLKELKQFNDSKGIPYKVPKVNAIEIDLYHFYTLVQQKGGLHKVNQSDTWDSFLRPLRLPHPCINGSTLLKRIYSMYLEKYERAKGPPGRDDDNDIDEDPRRTRGGGMPRITFSGGTYISGDAPKHTQTPNQDLNSPLKHDKNNTQAMINITNHPPKSQSPSQAESIRSFIERNESSASMQNRRVSAKQRQASATLLVDKTAVSKQRQVSSASFRNSDSSVPKTSSLPKTSSVPKTESELLPNITGSPTRLQKSSAPNKSNSVKQHKTEGVNQKSQTLDINTLVKHHRMSCPGPKLKRRDSLPKLILKQQFPEPLPQKIVVFPKTPMQPKIEAEPKATNTQEVIPTRRTKTKSAFTKKHYSKKVSKF